MLVKEDTMNTDNLVQIKYPVGLCDYTDVLGKYICLSCHDIEFTYEDIEDLCNSELMNTYLCDKIAQVITDVWVNKDSEE